MKTIKMVVFFTYVVSVFFCIQSVYAEAAEKPVVVYSTTKAPFYFLDEHEHPTGIHIDVWKMIFEELGVPYEFKIYESGSERIKNYVIQGKSFMHFNLSKKDDRMEWGIYPDESYLHKTISFFIRAEDTDNITYETLSDLKGLRVGASKSYTYTKAFWDAGLDLDVIQENHLHIPKLLNKRIDVVPMASINTLYQLKQEGNSDKIYVLPKPLTIRPYYNVFSKAYSHPDKQKILENYDRMIKRMKQDGTIQKIYEQYLGNVNFEWLK